MIEDQLQDISTHLTAISRRLSDIECHIDDVYAYDGDEEDYQNGLRDVREMLRGRAPQTVQQPHGSLTFDGVIFGFGDTPTESYADYLQKLMESV